MCVELVGATDTICVDNDEGRAELIDIPAGTYEVCVSHTVPYWYWAGSLGPASVTIAPGTSPTITLYEFFGGYPTDVIERRCGFDVRP